jgi:hypothetical protein
MPKHSPASQQFVAVKDIRDSVVLLKNGQMCSILLASSVNFALKSLDEQKAILAQFQQFLNTVDFTLQFFVQSRRLNIEPYTELLASLDSKQANDLMRIQLREYIEFVQTFTNEVNVMSKSFFVVVPYSPARINLTRGITNLFTQAERQAANPSENQFEESKIQLEQRVSVVSEGLARVGVRTITLGKDELVELFYHIYNPSDPTGSAPVINENT